MSKYNPDIMIEIMDHNEKDGWGCKRCSSHYGIACSQIYRWYQRYKELGVEVLQMKRKRYSGDFKRNVLEYIQQNRLSFKAGAIHFGIPNPSMIKRWDKRSRLEGPLSLDEDRLGEHWLMKSKIKKLKTDENSPREELLAEIEQLRMENAYLKN